MTQEEYNRLDADFAHCAGTHCEKSGKCLRHTAYTMLAGNGNETYRVVNSAVIKGAQPCPFFGPDRKERFAWGISRIYDNGRAADLRRARHEVMAASAPKSTTRQSSCAAPSPRKSNETSASPLPKWATTALPSNSTAMKNSIPH